MDYHSFQQQQQKGKLWGRGESDFQIHHIIIVKWSNVQFKKDKKIKNKNKAQKNKKPERMAQSKEQDKMTDTIPEGGQTLDLPDKDFITTLLNML